MGWEECKYLIVDTLNILTFMSKIRNIDFNFYSAEGKLKQQKLFYELWSRIKNLCTNKQTNTVKTVYFCAKYHNAQQKTWWMKIMENLFRKEYFLKEGVKNFITHLVLAPSPAVCLKGVPQELHHQCGSDDFSVLAVYNALRLTQKRKIKILSHDRYVDFEKTIDHHFPLKFSGFMIISTSINSNRVHLKGVLKYRAQFKKPKRDVFIDLDFLG